MDPTDQITEGYLGVIVDLAMATTEMKDVLWIRLYSNNIVLN